MKDHDNHLMPATAATEPLTGASDPPTVAPELVAFARRVRDDLGRLLMEAQFGIDEVLTKVSILQREFLHLHRYSPIEHVNSRVKTPESILEKVVRRGLSPTVDSIREHITDLAGVRITCSFIADTYRILELLTAHDDVTVLQVKDYIADPKSNGYKSLHAIIEVPVFLSDGPTPVRVEIQIRTIAMDFWASLEHKIYYKYDGAVPEHLTSSLTEAALAAEALDHRMEQLHTEVHGSAPDTFQGFGPTSGIDETTLRQLWLLIVDSDSDDRPAPGDAAEATIHDGLVDSATRTTPPPV